MRPASSLFSFALVTALTACIIDKDPLDELTQGAGPNPSTPASSDPSGNPSGDPTTDGTGTTGDDPTGGDPTGTPSAAGVDILFVIDNSGSMAEEQALLAQNIGALVGALEGRDVRIGITTTDVGNPRCPSATYTPEAGKMSAVSCVQGVADGEFTFNMNDFDYACTDFCQTSDLGIVPTMALGDEVKPRPWLERIGGVTNFDPGLTLTQALQCTLQRGVAGCGFESPLEATYRALALSQLQDADEFGFLRDDADLVIVIVTDEMDCSVSNVGYDIFTTNKVYWNDPADPAPTSAVCFRAGVQCEGDSPYTSCAAADKDLSGNLTDPDSAVLDPVSRYVDFLANIGASKANYGASVRLTAIAGVPVGFEDGLAELIFEDSPDSDYQNSFGIGPGCQLPDPNGGAPTLAVPPMRILDVAEALGAPKFYSICQNDFSAALAAIGSGP
jgi:hypothetical protein